MIHLLTLQILIIVSDSFLNVCVRLLFSIVYFIIPSAWIWISFSKLCSWEELLCLGWRSYKFWGSCSPRWGRPERQMNCWIFCRDAVLVCCCKESARHKEEVLVLPVSRSKFVCLTYGRELGVLRMKAAETSFHWRVSGLCSKGASWGGSCTWLECLGEFLCFCSTGRKLQDRTKTRGETTYFGWPSKASGSHLRLGPERDESRCLCLNCDLNTGKCQKMDGWKDFSIWVAR